MFGYRCQSTYGLALFGGLRGRISISPKKGTEPRVEGNRMRPSYNTRSVTLRIPAVIMDEINKRITDNVGRTDVILHTLCHAFGIAHPRTTKTETEKKHETEKA